MDAASFHLVTCQHTGPASCSLENYTLAQAEKLGKPLSETGYDVLTSAETKEKLGDITFITAELSGKEITANKKTGCICIPFF